VGVVPVGGQEGQPDRVAACAGQGEASLLGRHGQEAVRDLRQDARAIARRHLRTGCAAVGQTLENGQPPVDDVVVRPAVQVRHHANATGVVLECRVVEASGHRRPSE